MPAAAILGAGLVREALPQLDGFDEIVVIDPSVDALERLEAELADPRLDFLLGSLPVLPLPDGSVDRVVGEFAPDDPEVARVTGTQRE
ncbi:MAG TPA: class I SAM-dependent methyltransferase [Gaiellaceae bacterium]|nr:class I SAM-dependent methyltransferase [Gaiellaceae bacterium]